MGPNCSAAPSGEAHRRFTGAHWLGRQIYCQLLPKYVFVSGVSQKISNGMQAGKKQALVIPKQIITKS